MDENAIQDETVDTDWRSVLKEELPYIALLLLCGAVMLAAIKVADYYMNIWMWNFIQELSQSGMLDQTSLEWEVLPSEGTVVA